MVVIMLLAWFGVPLWLWLSYGPSVSVFNAFWMTAFSVLAYYRPRKSAVQIETLDHARHERREYAGEHDSHQIQVNTGVARELNQKRKGNAMSETAYETKIQILSEFWIDYKNDEEFEDFVTYNDLGLPLAYALANGIVEGGDLARSFIDETFATLLDSLNIEDDGYDDMADLFSASQRASRGSAVSHPEDSADDGTQHAKFCGQCGTSRLSEEAKFCVECGAPFVA